jgi:hypothetical protein
MLLHLAVLLFPCGDLIGAHKYSAPSPDTSPKHAPNCEPVMPPQSFSLGEFGADSRCLF